MQTEGQPESDADAEATKPSPEEVAKANDNGEKETDGKPVTDDDLQRGEIHDSMHRDDETGTPEMSEPGHEDEFRLTPEQLKIIEKWNTDTHGQGINYKPEADDQTGKGSPSEGGSPGGKTARQTSPPNRYGSPGKPDHQDATAELLKDLQQKYPESEGYTYEVNTSIKDETGLNRRPDVTVRDKNGKVVDAGEAARTNQDGSLKPREQKKQNDYKQAGVPSTVKKIPPAQSQTPQSQQQSQPAPASSGGT